MLALVTGALGNIGLATTQELLRQGHEVRCFDIDTRRGRKTARKLDPRATVCWGDITNERQVREAVDGVDAVIHNAAVLPPATERTPERAEAINFNGTAHLVRALEARGEDVPLVYTSSISVFGPGAAERGIATAESPVEATDRYTSQKLRCEELLKSSSVPWVILRIGVCMDMGGARVDPIQLRMMFEVAPDHPMEAVHSADVALAQANAATTPEARGKVLLIGGGPSCQIRHRDLFASAFDMLQIRDFPEEAFGKEPYYTCWIDTSESQRILQFQRSSFAQIHAELAVRYRPIKWLLRLASPLLRRHFLKLSGPWNSQPPRSGWSDFTPYF